MTVIGSCAVAESTAQVDGLLTGPARMDAKPPADASPVRIPAKPRANKEG